MGLDSNFGNTEVMPGGQISRAEAMHQPALSTCCGRTGCLENVVSDEDRLSFAAFGVSGTPTFVLVDEGKIVRSYSVG